jgi:XRE family transcriptional regulator, aerobic/anaerobic benzoate catabolism transcriptional regulator
VSAFLSQIGARVRRERLDRGLSRRELSEASGVSERFLAQLEGGIGNISLLRFAEVARALGASPSELLAAAEHRGSATRSVALLGLRGAGKSTVGAALGKRLSLSFVEVDHRIEQVAGLSLGQLFELHGEAYYRRIEREVLESLLPGTAPIVLAPGGSIVSSPDNFARLRRGCCTVWLRAKPEDHWARVIQQGDHRPMAKNPQAFEELRALLAEREPLYGAADHVVDTSGRTIAAVVKQVQALVAA